MATGTILFDGKRYNYHLDNSDPYPSKWNHELLREICKFFTNVKFSESNALEVYEDKKAVVTITMGLVPIADPNKPNRLYYLRLYKKSDINNNNKEINKVYSAVINNNELRVTLKVAGKCVSKCALEEIHSICKTAFEYHKQGIVISDFANGKNFCTIS